MQLTRGIVSRPRKLILYGQQGTGKTTLAASVPGIVMLDLEGGSLDLDCLRWPSIIRTYDDFRSALAWVFANARAQGITAVAIDSLTKLQELVHAKLTGAKNVRSVKEIGGGYGKGEDLTAVEFQEVRQWVDALVNEWIAVVMIAHADDVKREPPDAPHYTEWMPDLHEKVREPFVRYADEVFFLRQKTYVKTEKTGFGAERNQQIAMTEREIVTMNPGAICAKHRLGTKYPGFPDSMTLEQFPAYIRELTPPRPQPVATVAPNPEPVTPSNAVSQELADTFPA